MDSAGDSPTAAQTTHVAFLAFPFGTHAAPLFALARALAAAGPPTAAFSFLCSARAIAGLPPPGAANLKVYPVSDGCPDPPPPDVVENIGMFLEATPGNFKEGMEAAVNAAGGVAVSCVVSDAFLSMAGSVAEEMGVPWVPLWTGGPGGLLAHVYTDVLRRTIGVGEQAVPGRADELLHFIPGLSTIRVRDLPEGIVHGGLVSGISLLLHRMADVLPRASVVTLNTIEGLDPDVDATLKEKFKQLLPIGPLNLLTPLQAEPIDAHGCLPWLDRQAHATVAYISFGTVMSPPPAELAELAEGLESSGVPFLWSIRDTISHHLPPGFLERTKGRGLVVPWAPQTAVLRHAAVGVFVTHCGWNSVLESITSGVPMVCRPFFGDQKINSRFVSQMWRIGVGFDGGSGFTKETAASALRAVLMGDEGKKMRERAHKLMAKAVQAVGPGGISTENFNTLLKIVCRC